MTSHSLALIFLCVCIVAAPIVKSIRRARGVRASLAYLAGFAVLAVAVVVVRIF